MNASFRFYRKRSFRSFWWLVDDTFWRWM